MHAPSRQWEGK
jgi:hypothetical protein